MIKILRGLQPFKTIPRRSHIHFPNIPKSCMDELDVMLLKTWLTRHKNRLARGKTAAGDEDDVQSDDDNDGRSPDEGVPYGEDSSDTEDDFD